MGEPCPRPGTPTAARGEKPWPRVGNSDGRPWGRSVAAYGEDGMAVVRRLSRERRAPRGQQDQRRGPLIEPLFEQKFLAASFGYWPRNSAGQAVYWVREAIRRGDRFVAEFDIVSFFDNLRHPRLLTGGGKGSRRPPEVIGLIRRWPKAGVLTDDVHLPSEAGTPQAGWSPRSSPTSTAIALMSGAAGGVPPRPLRGLRDPHAQAVGAQSHRRPRPPRPGGHRARGGRGQVGDQEGHGRVRVPRLLQLQEGGAFGPDPVP